MRVELELAFSFKRQLDADYRHPELPEGARAAEAVAVFVARFPRVGERLLTDQGEIRRNVNALINGGNVTLREGFATRLAEGDRLTLLPPVGGG